MTHSAFVEEFIIEPTANGVLNGLTFAVKDLIDIAGKVTGCGNPSWRETHAPAASHGVSVEQLLAAGAKCLGKTITDELAFSLLGENHWYGTPLNAAAPDRIPGGSSSGSASAVASKIVDFALGTDTGGSVRVPASNCGIIGWRPTHGRVNVAGVMPFAPSLDTVGVFARDVEVLRKVMGVLIGSATHQRKVSELVVPREIWEIADAEVRDALLPSINELSERFDVREEVMGWNYLEWWQTYREVQGLECWSSLGAWIQATKPEFGPKMKTGFEWISTLDRKSYIPGMARRESLAARFIEQLGDRVLVIPTTPVIAPRKGEEIRRDAGPMGYYPRTLGSTALAGLSRCPQISFPMGNVNGVPIGLSLIGTPGTDAMLLDVIGVR